MKKAWKVILILALCILILGELILGVGLLSGGSPERVWDLAFEHYNIKEVVEYWNSDAVQGRLKPLGDLLGIEIPTFDIVEESPEPTATPEPTPTPAPTPTQAPSAEPTATAAP